MHGRHHLNDKSSTGLYIIYIFCHFISTEKERERRKKRDDQVVCIRERREKDIRLTSLCWWQCWIWLKGYFGTPMTIFNHDWFPKCSDISEKKNVKEERRQEREERRKRDKGKEKKRKEKKKSTPTVSSLLSVLVEMCIIILGHINKKKNKRPYLLNVTRSVSPPHPSSFHESNP